MIRPLIWLLSALLCCGMAQGQTASEHTDAASDSLHQLTSILTDQDGRDFTLADYAGEPVIVAMFYTSCRYVCPLIIDSLRGVEHALDEAERQHVRLLLISLDSVRDDPAALRRVVDRRTLDTTRWTLARAEAADVRRIAAVLGVRYRALADGEFNHTSSMVLIDREGRRMATTAASGAVPAESFVASVRTTLSENTVSSEQASNDHDQ